MFDKTLVSNRYSVNTSDSCVYFKIECDYVIICLYVDGMLMFGNNVNVVNETKLFLSSHFGIKDLREAYMILGIKLRKTKNDFSLCQSHYIEKILKMFNYFDEMPVRTPFDSSIHLKKNKGPNLSQDECAKILGSVMCLMNYTRLDIAYAVNRLSRYTYNPSSEH